MNCKLGGLNVEIDVEVVKKVAQHGLSMSKKPKLDECVKLF